MFSGSGILSQTFKEMGHQATTCDKYIKSDIKKDIRDITIGELLNYDVIWLSPPCQTFSLASGNRHWTKDRKPKTDQGKEAKEIIKICKNIAWWCMAHKKIFFIENPRCRTRWFLPKQWRKTISYCRYGDNRMKPTDIWTNCGSWIPRPMCHNGNSDHIQAPRGSKTGTQGLSNAYERGKLPKELCIEIVKACEIEIIDLIIDDDEYYEEDIPLIIDEDGYYQEDK